VPSDTIEASTKVELDVRPDAQPQVEAGSATETLPAETLPAPIPSAESFPESLFDMLPPAPASLPLAEAIVVIEPIAPVEPTAEMMPVPIEATSPPPMELEATVCVDPPPAVIEQVLPDPVEISNVQAIIVPEEAALPPSCVVAPEPPQFVEPTRSAPQPSNTRPPVGPPRQMRRRARSTFHR
jgi:hypothetical protein